MKPSTHPIDAVTLAEALSEYAEGHQAFFHAAFGTEGVHTAVGVCTSDGFARVVGEPIYDPELGVILVVETGRGPLKEIDHLRAYYHAHVAISQASDDAALSAALERADEATTRLKLFYAENL